MAGALTVELGQHATGDAFTVLVARLDGGDWDVRLPAVLALSSAQRIVLFAAWLVSFW